MIDSKTEAFTRKAAKKYNNKYDYSEAIYTGWDDPVTIICYKHGRFEQSPYKHLNGQECAVCKYEETGKSYYFNSSIFELKSREIHGDRYDYSEVEYVNNKTHVKIICKKHGPFYQMPYVHFRGSGCPRCAGNCAKPKYTGWTLDSYKKSAEASSYFKGFELYIFQIRDKCEDVFYKIGITYIGYKRRLYSIPYKEIRLISLLELPSAEEVWNLETRLQKLCSSQQYYPKKDFAGKTECFSSIDPIRPLLMEEFLT